MKISSLIFSVALIATTQGAVAAGCLKGAAVGGVGGHFAGHHGLLGAAVGCGVGHHMAKKHEKEREAEQARQNQERLPANSNRVYPAR